MKINIENLQDDMRKIAVGFVLGGGLGFFTDKISTSHARIIGIIGLFIWIIGLLEVG